MCVQWILYHKYNFFSVHKLRNIYYLSLTKKYKLLNYDYETEFFSVLMTIGQFFCRAVDSNQGLYERF